MCMMVNYVPATVHKVTGTSVMDNSVDTFEQNRDLTSASFFVEIQPSLPLPFQC